ncbi:hypothetical protein PTTG_28782 [Puccinia triticina 1-1 BBBD Race 1]|uniref:Uncharacterized protein n=1 Tax=Puccinia triticina (isolate 1-1 / race 1 (BBBD)) TaxID=630390 RepID=A0A180G8X5_PUCT1|nr:hypothetical protein PTTG_28782 [Puccinia triticina 1-1 BBBD Race 1]
MASEGFRQDQLLESLSPSSNRLEEPKQGGLGSHSLYVMPLHASRRTRLIIAPHRHLDHRGRIPVPATKPRIVNRSSHMRTSLVDLEKCSSIIPDKILKDILREWSLNRFDPVSRPDPTGLPLVR